MSSVTLPASACHSPSLRQGMDDGLPTVDQLLATADRLYPGGHSFSHEMLEQFLDAERENQEISEADESAGDATPVAVGKPGHCSDLMDENEEFVRPSGPAWEAALKAAREEVFQDCFSKALVTMQRLMDSPNVNIAYKAAADVIALQTTWMRHGRAVLPYAGRSQELGPVPRLDQLDRDSDVEPGP